jgi:uncharacterized membrane protein (UPF0127 family)
MLDAPAPSRATPLALLATFLLLACGGGGPKQVFSTGEHPLDHLDRAAIRIHDDDYVVWLAKTAEEQQQGLMGITEADLAPLPDGTERGMLFVWSVDVMPSFWMKDTTVPLDLAYVRADGVITETHALQPLDETPVPASTPIRYALEVRQGVFATRGIGPGDVVSIPPGVHD